MQQEFAYLRKVLLRGEGENKQEYQPSPAPPTE
jgi:hypothetical protein